MERITPADVRHALAHYVDTLERYGIDPGGRVGMDEGSPTYGRAWRLYVIPEGQSGHTNPPVGSDYLGWSRAEAYAALTTRTRTMHDMAHALKLERHETTQDRVNASLEAEYERRQQVAP
jgi:hypothetical protein